MAAARRNAKDPGLAEAIEVHTSDGHVLRATVREPKKGERAQGVAVLAHAMFARKSEWERGGRGLARFLSDARMAHDRLRLSRSRRERDGRRRRGGAGRTRISVQRDLPAVVEGARARGRGKRVIVVGHSLGGHVAAAAQATGAIDVDAIALVASNVWLEEIEPLVPANAREARDWACDGNGVPKARVLPRALAPPGKRRRGGGVHGGALARRRAGLLGERRRAGRLLGATARRRRAALLALASDGDPINAHPECAARFALRARGRVTIDRIRRERRRRARRRDTWRSSRQSGASPPGGGWKRGCAGEHRLPRSRLPSDRSAVTECFRQ